MRLTLRTLLAYLDDILDAQDAREIGQKAAESSYASALINRIRDVMRQRRLTAPDVSGPGSGLDPNAVAEYLDNTLPPEGVADIERVCLESDIHLAEVAACHQILTLVLGEPVDVLPEMRDRIYSLGPRTKAPSKAQPKRNNGQTATVASTAQSSSFGDQIPEYLKPKPLWKQIAFPVCMLLVFLLWLGSFFMDDSSALSNMFAGGPGNNDDAASTINSAKGAAIQNPPDNAEPVVDESDEKPLTTEIDVPEEITSTTPSIPPGLDRTPPPDLPEVPFEKPPAETTVTEPEPPIATTLPETPEEPVAVAKPFPTEETTTNETVVPTATPKVEEAPADTTPVTAATTEVPEAKPSVLPTPIQGPALPIKFISPDGIMLTYNMARTGWFVSPNRQAIPGNDWLATPEPYTNVLDVGDGMCRVKMHGNTAVRILGATNAGMNGFEIVRGKVAFEAGPGMSINPDEHPKLGIQINDEYWKLELLTPDAVCGFQVDRRTANKYEEDLGRNSYDGAFYVIAGSVRFTSSSGNSETLSNRDWRMLTPEVRDAAKNSEEAPVNKPLLDVPEWLDSSKKSTRALQQSAKLFEREFDEEQAVGLFMPAVIKTPRPRISELAVQCLALTNNHEALVQALAQSEHEESRMAAIFGLRTWLPTAEENRGLLKDALSKYFQPADIESIYELLWGYEKKSGTNKYTSRKLVTWLQHDHIAIRELAIYHVRFLTGKTNDFRANAPEARRQASINRWEMQLKKVGTLVAE